MSALRSLRIVSLLSVLSLITYGQLNRGSITGTVTDSANATVAGARVLAEGVETGLKQATVTNEFGQYTVPNLPVGRYRVSVEAHGFKTALRDNLELGVTQTLRVDAMLQVGTLTETVEVTAEVARLQTDVPEVSTTLSSDQLAGLPIQISGDSGRLAEEFAYKIMPGLSGDTWKSSVNGSPAFSKETLLDGASVSTYLPGHNGESAVSIEALQEFKVQTSGMSAEVGRTQGGVFNYVLKSGNNQLHGSAFGGLRNEAFNANDFSNKSYGRKRGLDRRWDYAGSLGGPVVLPKLYNGRNRTFFYAAYDQFQMRQTGLGAATQSIPVPEFYDGDFSRLLGASIGQTDGLGNPVLKGAIYDPASFRQLTGGRWVGDMFPGNRIPKARISQVALNMNAIASKYVPAIKGADGLYALQNNAFALQTSKPKAEQFMFSAKGDQILTDKQRLSGSFARTLRPRLRGGNGGFWDDSQEYGGLLTAIQVQTVASHLGRVAWDYTIKPTMMNQFLVAFNRLTSDSRGPFSEIDGGKMLGIKNLTTFGMPLIDWGGGPYYKLANPGGAVKSLNVYQSWQLSDTVSFSRGRHFMKAGWDMRGNLSNERPTQGGSLTFAARGTSIPNETYSGTNTGYAFASYLLGIVDSASLVDPVGLGGRRRYFAAFVQDDWKVNSRLTLNLGLRWEYARPFFEAADRLSSWTPNEKDPATGLMGAYQFAGNCQGCTGERYFGQSHMFRDWGPRFGFAYNAGRGFTVRGAYGIFYDADLFNSYSAVSLYKQTSVQVGGTWMLGSDAVTPWAGLFNWDKGFPSSLYAPAGYDKSWGDKNKPGFIDPAYGVTPYAQQWNINIQKQLPSRVVLDVGYVGNKGTGLHNGNLAVLNQIPFSAITKYGKTLTNAVTSQAQADANGVAYPFAGFKGTVASALRPYPQVRANDTISAAYSPLGFSTYHSLQVTANRQFAKGLTVYTNYVWSKSLTNTESQMVGDNAAPLDYYNLGLEKALSSDDVPHRFKAYVDYELPFGHGRKFLSGANRLVDSILGGWNVSAIVNYASGMPIGFSAPSPLPNAWNGGNRANVAAGELKNTSFNPGDFNILAGSAASNTYLNKAAYSLPAALTLGTSAPRYGQVRGFGTKNEDMTLMKSFTFAEKYKFQLRADFLNVLNRHWLGGPNTDLQNSLFGQITSASGARNVQLGARLDF